MSTMGKTQIGYPEAFAALGRFVAKEGINNVCVMEFEGGIIVTGSKVYTAGESLKRYVATHVLSNDDLQRLVNKGA